MNWFTKLFGFKELGVDGRLNVKDVFSVVKSQNGNFILRSGENHKQFPVGRFHCPSLKLLRNSLPSQGNIPKRPTSYQHIAVTDILTMHCQYPGATFQAASQFNCLEFANPEYTPENGVTIYVCDNTQGPACALACAAGTVYRNYFAPVNSQIGQSMDNQINNLIELETLLDNKANKYWQVRNGYVFSSPDDLIRLNKELTRWKTQNKWDELVQCVRVGVHNDVGVTFGERYEPLLEEPPTTVNQVYCSAISCAYSGVSNSHWELLATIALEAAYEATLWAGVASSHRHSSSSSIETVCRRTSEMDSQHIIFLTLLGGGVFGNEPVWIASAMGKAIASVIRANADVKIVICHHRVVDENMKTMIDMCVDLELRGKTACAAAHQTS